MPPQALRPLHSPAFQPALAAATMFMLAASASAQSNDNEWIRPTGGSWNNPRNWSLGFVPTFSTNAYFRLDDDLAVSTSAANVFELLVQGSRLQLEAPGCGNDGGDGLLASAIRVENDIDGLGRRGVFRLLDATCGKSQSDETWVYGPIGRPDGLNEFILAGDSTFTTDNLNIHPLSGLGFELGEIAPTDSLIRIHGESYPDCGLRLRGFGGEFPIADTNMVLLDATGASSTARVVMPRFGYLEPPADRSVEIVIQTDQEGWDDLLTASIQQATTEVRLDTILAEPTSLELVELITNDFNADGRADLAGFFADGTLAVLLQTPAGGFVPSLFTSGVDSNITDGTAGDFDGNGTIDLAVISRLEGDSGIVRLYLNSGSGGPSDWSAGPSADYAGAPVSIAPLGTAAGFKQAGGRLAVTTSENGRGETKSYETTGSSVTKTGGFEVGDDPGPSDPIQDENKKDPDPPVGVGNDATALGGGGAPRFSVLQPVPGGGFEALQQFSLPGRCVDFASADLDGDGKPEVIVLTDNDAAVLLRPLQNWTNGRAVSIPPSARSIAIGDVDGDGELEVVIGFDKMLRIHTIRIAPTPGALSADAGVFLELERVLDLGSLAAGQVAIGTGGSTRLLGGLDDGSNGSGLFAWDVDEVPTGGCEAADLDGNGVVDGSDIGLLIAAWGQCEGCSADINGDGKVDGADLAQIIAFWGSC